LWHLHGALNGSNGWTHNLEAREFGEYIEFRNGKVVHETQYFADPFDALLPFQAPFEVFLPAMTEKKIRVLIAKPGLDGHDRGAKIIARALRDAGMEVIYTGLRQTPEMIASAAVQEDVDVIGLSILSGAHNTLCPRLMELLRDKGMDDVTVLIGGIIPEADIPALKKGGIAEVFLPGTPTQAIVDFIRERITPAPASA
jgi:methylmalonyl-CoA mutase C-terminal domain/subunit